MDRQDTRMIEDTAQHLAKVAKLGRAAWCKLATEVDGQDNSSEIYRWLPELEGLAADEDEEGE